VPAPTGVEVGVKKNKCPFYPVPANTGTTGIPHLRGFFYLANDRLWPVISVAGANNKRYLECDEGRVTARNRTYLVCK
jgi:hypothetical protein